MQLLASNTNRSCGSLPRPRDWTRPTTQANKVMTWRNANQIERLNPLPESSPSLSSPPKIGEVGKMAVTEAQAVSGFFTWFGMSDFERGPDENCNSPATIL